MACHHDSITRLRQLIQREKTETVKTAKASSFGHAALMNIAHSVSLSGPARNSTDATLTIIVKASPVVSLFGFVKKSFEELLLIIHLLGSGSIISGVAAAIYDPHLSFGAGRLPERPAPLFSSAGR